MHFAKGVVRPTSGTLVFQTLLELGASPDYKDSYGLTPLYHTAIVGGDPYCCELLLHEHAAVCCRDENGWHEIHQVRARPTHASQTLPRSSHPPRRPSVLPMRLLKRWDSSPAFKGRDIYLEIHVCDLVETWESQASCCISVG